MVRPTTTPHKSKLETIDVIPEATPTVQPGFVLRRIGAWATEVGLVLASGLIPLGLGMAIAQRSAQQLPLNPVLQTTQTFLAQEFKIPKQKLVKTVPPLTNLLWSLGLFAPFVVTGTYLHQSLRRGQTLPKKWFELRITNFKASSLNPALTLKQVGLRELGRWGLPLGGAYVLGLMSGTGLVGIWLPSFVGLCLIAENATVLWNRDRRAWHDRLAGTQVVGTRPDEVALTYHVAPEDIVERASSSQQRPTLHGSELDDLAGVDDQLAEVDGPKTFILTEADSGLTSIILAPRPALPLLPQWKRPNPRYLMIGGTILGGVMVLGGTIIASQFYFQRQTHAQSVQHQSDTQFLATASTLIETSAVPDEYQAAILALARVGDPRALQYLGDLLTQTENPQVLTALQQAFTSQGLMSVPILQTLSQTLNSELSMTVDEGEQLALLKRQQIVKRSLATLLTLHEGDLTDTNLNKIDLGRETSSEAPFVLRLNRINAAGTQWRGALLDHASLQSTSFFDPGPDGQSGTYDDVISDFSGADLKEANLSQTDFRGSQLVNTSLLRANLNQSHLSQANLSGSNLSGAQLIEADATSSEFLGSILVGADLTQASFSQADLSEARLNRVEAAETTWVDANLQNTYWLNANLNGADFSRTNLSQALLQDTNLKGANFTSANLSHANLSNADLSEAILTGTNLTGVDFRGARFSSRRGAFAESFITTAPNNEDSRHLDGVDFSRAVNLSPQQLMYICAQGGSHTACR